MSLLSSAPAAAAAPDSPVARVKWLVAPTSAGWLEQAIEHPDLVLIDHAHCERKAAGAALQLMFRYPAEPGLGECLSPLAREELEHFERVLGLLERRGLALRPLPAPPYGATLSRAVRRAEPQRMLDSFLVAGLIEARSHERMALLAAHSPEAELRHLYGELLASEARHFGLYWLLCERRWERALVLARLQELAEVEGQALAGAMGVSEAVRMHSAGVVAGGSAGLATALPPLP
jgi:tRNA-(ms[2]io[6]A)-hydroxylase